MHITIDILAGITLLFFFLIGWNKGFLQSLLSVLQIILSCGAAYFSGRYLGFWLGEIIHRPRLITIPVCAVLAFTLVAFTFYIILHEIREDHQEKEEKENVQRSFFSCLSGGAIHLASGTLLLALLFWMGNLFLIGAAGRSIPGADDAQFGRFTRRAVYETAAYLIPKHNNESQVDCMARMISDPSRGINGLKKIRSADSIKQFKTDQQFADDLLSGDATRIQHNASVQHLFDDRETLNTLRELGLLSGYETKSGLCDKLAAFGQNKKIQSSIESLKAKQLLNTKNIPALIRDPDFDVILAELIR